MPLHLINAENKQKSKDPLLALMFAFVFTGLGHLYSGRVKRGVIFLCLHLLFVASLVGLIAHPTAKTNIYFLLPIYIFFVFEVFVVVDAYVFIRFLHKQNRLSKQNIGKRLITLAAIFFFMFIFNLNILMAMCIKSQMIAASQITSSSMRPTLWEGDRFFIDKMAYQVKDPQIGDVVVFDDPKDEKRALVKRIIAQGGQTLEIKNGHIQIDGHPLKTAAVDDIQYYNRGSFGQENQLINVPLGYYYLLGDNSLASIDSRHWGFVSKKNIIGKVSKIYFPFKRSGAVK